MAVLFSMLSFFLSAVLLVYKNTCLYLFIFFNSVFSIPVVATWFGVYFIHQKIPRIEMQRQRDSKLLFGHVDIILFSEL